MRHHCPLSPYHLTPDEVNQFLQLAQAHRSPQALARRARIVLSVHAHPTWSSKQIAKSLSVNDRLVRKWRRRWQESRSLKDAPRSGAPRRFSSQARAQVTALACSLPRSHGGPLAHWSRAALARHVATIPTTSPISAKTIGRWPDFRADSSPSGSTPGNTSKTLKRFWSVLAPCCSYMNRPLPCSSRAPGWFVPMKRPRSRLVRQNRLLVQPCQNIQSISPRAIVAMAHCS
jgi:hypothetical protein